MTRLFLEPPIIKKGPGCALGTRKVRRRRKYPPSAREVPNELESFSTGDVRIALDIKESDASRIRIEECRTASVSTESASVPTRALTTPCIHLALALDSRLPDTQGAHAVGDHFLNLYEEVIDTLDKRGVRPKVIVGSAKSHGGELSQCHIVDKNRALRKAAFSVDDQGSHIEIPEGLKAAHSWNLLGAFVERILHVTQIQGMENQLTSLELRIFTSDVSFFSDTSVRLHLMGVERFWNNLINMLGKQDDSMAAQLVRITLSIFRTNSLAMPRKSNELECQQQPKLSMATSRSEYEEVVQLCFQAIEEKVVQLSGRNAATNIDFSLSFVDGTTLDCKSLSREIIRNIVFAGNLWYPLTLDLPVTPDGTHCQVALEVSYYTLPYSIDRPEFSTMHEKLRKLSKSSLNLVQLAPVSSIDASLLFDVPFAVRSRIVGTIDQCQQMERLTRVFFSFLQKTELVVLLRSRSDDDTFILMPKEFPRTTQQVPHEGLLFRYTHADQLFLEASNSRSCLAVIVDDNLDTQYTDYIEEALSGVICSPINPLDFCAPQCSEGRPETRLANHVASAKVREITPIDKEETTPNQYQIEKVSRESHHDESDILNDSTGVGSRFECFGNTGSDDDGGTPPSTSSFV